MLEKITPPDFEENRKLLDDLYNDVKNWEGHLSGGAQQGIGAETIDQLRSIRVKFGNPRNDLRQLTEEKFDQIGVKLSPLHLEQIRNQFDFYMMSLPINLVNPGGQFKALYCRLNFGPTGPQEPIVQTIFPEAKWRPVLNWGGGLSLAVNSDLEWSIGLDTSAIDQVIQKLGVDGLPVEAQANIANKNDLKAHILINDYNYDVGRFDIAAYGAGDSECYWAIEEPDLQKMSTVQLAMVFKVPKGTEEFTLKGVVWAEPNINWLVANIKNVFRDISEKLQSLLKQKDSAARKLASGTSEIWSLPLSK